MDAKQDCKRNWFRSCKGRTLDRTQKGKTMIRKRRGRNEGSIFKRADGSWSAIVSLGFDENGKRRRRQVYGVSKAQVQQKLRQLQADTGNGRAADADRLTLAKYMETWLAGVKPTVEPNTYVSYERHVRKHISPHVGNVKLGQVDTA